MNSPPSTPDSASSRKRRGQLASQTAPLPNVKKVFISDPNYIIIDCDLAQADAQVVAWEADDNELKDIFRDPTADLHNENSVTIFGRVNKRNRQLAKGGVHAVNYDVRARTLAKALGITVHEADRFIRIWFEAHPNIRVWQYRIRDQLALTRRVENKFGNFRYYFDRVDTLLSQALAWIPQSTVALVISRGLVNIHNNLPLVQPLMQVHDSLVMQVHKAHYYKMLPLIKKNLEISIPYSDPLIIPVGIDVSAESCGAVREVSWETGEYQIRDSSGELIGTERIF